MKILYISYDGMTDALGRSQVIPYLEGLAWRGYAIDVISCEKKQVSHLEKDKVNQIFKKSSIGWYPLDFSSAPHWWSKFLDVTKIKKLATRLHATHHYDIVHCRSYIAALAGLNLKKRQGVKFVFDMRGFWANERIEGYIWNLNNPVYRLIYNYFKRKEKDFFRHSDAVVSLTYNGKQVIRELFGKEIHDKTTVVPCCVDTDLFSPDKTDPIKLQQLRRKFSVADDAFVLSYLGSTGTWYMTDEMMMFFKRMKQTYTQARFLFITGDDPELILKKAHEHGLQTSDIIIVKSSREEVPSYLTLSDLSIFFIRPVFSKKASSPTKQAELLSMGIPLICNTGVGDTDRIMADEKAGLVVQDFSDAEFDKAISKIASLRKLDPGAIRQKAIESFNLETGIEEYHRIYLRLMNKDEKKKQHGDIQ